MRDRLKTNARIKKYRLRLKAAGLCQACGHKPSNGKARCRECAERVLVKRRKKGCCKVCGCEIGARLRYCPSHKPTEAAKSKEKRRERSRMGVCSACGKNPVFSKIYCHSCLEKARTSAREAYRKLRLEVLAHYGNKCTCCGEMEPDFLSLDHKDNDGAKERKLIKAGSAMYKYVKKNWPTNLQIHCHNCNMAKGFYGICPHERARTGESSGLRIRIIRGRMKHATSCG